MLDPEQLAGFRARVAAVNNRAVFEIPEIVATLLASRRDPARAHGSILQPEMPLAAGLFLSYSHVRTAS